MTNPVYGILFNNAIPLHMERRQFKNEATLDKTAVEITDAEGLVAEKMIITCGCAATWTHSR